MTNLNDFLKNFSDISTNIEYPEYNFKNKKKFHKKDLIEMFKKFWELAGGKVYITKKNLILYTIEKLNIIRKNNSIYSLINLKFDYFKKYDIQILNDNDIKKPEDFDKLDIFILEASIAIANQGAIWIPKNMAKFDSSIFLCKYQIFLLNEKYFSMEDAFLKWKKLTIRGGYWVSGPSKTADIEQSLVIGAHGPLDAIVIIY